MMNTKDIKDMRWHKKSLIDALIREGIEIRDISVVLDGVINDLDEKRGDEIFIAVAHAAGVLEGRVVGYSDGWDAAMESYEINDAGMQQRDSDDHDQHNPRISITEGTFGGYSVYVDNKYIGHHSSWDIAMEMGSNYIAGRWD